MESLFVGKDRNWQIEIETLSGAAFVLVGCRGHDGLSRIEGRRQECLVRMAGVVWRIAKLYSVFATYGSLKLLWLRWTAQNDPTCLSEDVRDDALPNHTAMMPTPVGKHPIMARGQHTASARRKT